MAVYQCLFLFIYLFVIIIIIIIIIISVCLFVWFCVNLSACVRCQLTLEDSESMSLMASKLMQQQTRSGSLVPFKSTTSSSVKLSLTQQFHAAGIYS